MLHVQNSPCESLVLFLVMNPRKLHRLIQKGYSGLSPVSTAKAVYDSRGPCRSLQHPTSRTDAPQRRNHVLCQASLTPIPAVHCVLSCLLQGMGHGLVGGCLN